MHQKYTMVFSSNTNLVFITVLKNCRVLCKFFFYIQENITVSCVAFKTVALKMLFTVESWMLTAMYLIMTGLNFDFNEVNEAVKQGRPQNADVFWIAALIR